MENKIKQKKIINIFKYLNIIIFSILIFKMTTMTANALHCAGVADCLCDPSLNCAGETCWWYNKSSKCVGHDFYDLPTSTTLISSTNPCCDHSGVNTYKKVEAWACHKCNGAKGDTTTYPTSPNGSPTGHSVSGWYRENDSYHIKSCQNSGHKSCDGDVVRSREGHIAGNEHQHNDWYWHKDCTKCTQTDVQKGHNQVQLITISPDWSKGYEDSPNIFTLESRKIKNSKHTTGYVRDASKSGTFTINQTTGATAPYDYAVGTSKTGRQWCPSAQDNHYSSLTLYGVWQWNYIKVRYFTGWKDGFSTPYATDYVDASGQTLTSRGATSRTGYDVVSKGWFLNNSSNKKHNYAYKNPNECSDTHYIAFNQKRNAVNWCKDSTGMVKFDIANTDIITIDLVEHWRAHQLTIKYDKNIKGSNGSYPNEILGTQIMYYDDGYDMGTTYNPTKYSLSTIYPTRSGYTFMGWGANRSWCKTRYATNSANGEAQGMKKAYDYTVPSTDKRLAQDWATIGGKNLASSDQTITLYAQWERIISYKFYYYKEDETNKYTYNLSTVAFHNDDHPYLYMDLYMNNEDKRESISEDNRSANKIVEIPTVVTFNHSKDWAARGFSTSTSNTAEIDISTIDNTTILPLDNSYEKTKFKNNGGSFENTTSSEVSKYSNFVNKILANKIFYYNNKTDKNPVSFLYSKNNTTRYIKIYPDYAQTENYYLSYQRVVKTEYHDYAVDIKHNGAAYNTSHVDKKTSYMNYSANATTSTFTTHNQCKMEYTESSASGAGKKEPWIEFGWASSILNDTSAKSAYKPYSYTDYTKQKVAANALEPKFIDQKTTFKTNRDIDFYGLYYKDVKITYDLNGGNGIRAKRHSRSVGKPIGFIFLPFFIINIVLIIYFLTPSVYVFARNPTLPPRFQTGHTVLV